jgi:hypothetical protein
MIARERVSGPAVLESEREVTTDSCEITKRWYNHDMPYMLTAYPQNDESSEASDRLDTLAAAIIDIARRENITGIAVQERTRLFITLSGSHEDLAKLQEKLRSNNFQAYFEQTFGGFVETL